LHCPSLHLDSKFLLSLAGEARSITKGEILKRAKLSNSIKSLPACQTTGRVAIFSGIFTIPEQSYRAQKFSL